MGEYARQYTLERFGVDIGGDDDDARPARAKRPVPAKPFGCSCGRAFRLQQALAQHQSATGHVPSKRAAQGQEGGA